MLSEAPHKNLVFIIGKMETLPKHKTRKCVFRDFVDFIKEGSTTVFPFLLYGEKPKIG